jgi:hypothetical protein
MASSGKIDHGERMMKMNMLAVKIDTGTVFLSLPHLIAGTLPTATDVYLKRQSKLAEIIMTPGKSMKYMNLE